MPWWVGGLGMYHICPKSFISNFVLIRLEKQKIVTLRRKAFTNIKTLNKQMVDNTQDYYQSSYNHSYRRNA
jgi:hypothetical protein